MLVEHWQLLMVLIGPVGWVGVAALDTFFLYFIRLLTSNLCLQFRLLDVLHVRSEFVRFALCICAAAATLLLLLPLLLLLVGLAAEFQKCNILPN